MKSIFVTGTGSGIGRATAHLFARHGWFVGVSDANEASLRAVADEIGGKSRHAVRLDVTDYDDYERAIAGFAAHTNGRLDVLFNCAGILRQSPFEMLSRDDERAILHVNVLGVSNGIHATLGLLKATRGAHIVSMSPSAAIFGVPEEAMYSASKFAVRALTPEQVAAVVWKAAHDPKR